MNDQSRLIPVTTVYDGWMTSTQWLGDIEAKPAPEPLRRVQAFINTIDLESGRDRLANAEDARPMARRERTARARGNAGP